MAADPSLLDQLLPALGVLAGLFAKGLIDWTTQRRSWTREERVRYLEQKRLAYADVYAGLEMLDQAHRRRAEGLERLQQVRDRAADGGTRSDEEAAETDRLIAMLEQTAEEAFASIARIEASVTALVFLAPDTITEAAAHADRVAGTAEYPAARQRFLDACRRDLQTDRA